MAANAQAVSSFDKCLHGDQSQMRQNYCSAQDQKVADKELNVAYKEAMSRLDPAAKEKLRVEQRAWIKTAEGTCKKNTDDDVCSDEKADDDTRICGTMWDSEYFGCLKEADDKRTTQLKAIK